MAWSVDISKLAKKQLAELPKKQQQLISRAIDRMADDPFSSNVKPLVGSEWKGHFRRRVGNYRVIFFPKYDEQKIVIRLIKLKSKATYR